MKLVLVAFLLTFSGTIFCQAPTTHIEGYLELYHPNDTTSMYIGRKVGDSLQMTSPSHNTIIGNHSAIKIENSKNNIIVGENSITDIRQSGRNVFIGNRIGDKLFRSSRNVVIGIEAGSLITEGDNNTLIGDQAGKGITDAIEVTAVGSLAGSGDLSGRGNSFFGSKAGVKNTTGEYNCFLGSWAGLANETGSRNIHIGNSAGASFTHGNDNVIVSSTLQTLFLFGTGSANVFVGNEAGLGKGDGNHNTFIGHKAGYFMGGSNNVVLGSNAGATNLMSDVSSRLYINNEQSDQPLIYGEFENDLVQINGSLKSRALFLENPDNDDGIISSDTLKNSSDLFLKSNDKVIIDLDSNDDENSSFSVRNSDGATIFNLLENGNLSVDGTLVHTSDINRKYNINTVNSNVILEKVQALDIDTWKYKGTEETHLGPMAQDFYAAFGLGAGETTIATVDADGVALAAIKALANKNKALEKNLKDQHLLLQAILTELETIKKKLK